MARTMNKDKDLTIEERLNQVLVPDVEQPYRIPKNWEWVMIKSIARFGMGQTIISKDLKDHGIPIYSASSSDEIFGYIDSKDNKVKLSHGDFVIAARGTIGHVIYIVENEACCTQTTMYMKPYNKNISKYLYYVFNCFAKKIFIATGATIPQLTIKSLDNKFIPLAPLAEQQRIVELIEDMFAKLDEAKAKAQAVIDGYEDCKTAILHKAFTGELTAEWVKQHDISSNSWKIKNFEDVAEIKSNLVEPSEYPNYPHIAPDNIEKKTGVLLAYHTVAEDGIKSGKHKFYAGQILYSKIRPNLSKVIIVNFDGLCSADMYPIEPKDGMNTKFLWYQMLSDDFVLQASTAGSRSVLPKINQKELSSLKIWITDLKEQERVVAVLDKLFKKEQRIKDAAEQVIDQIDNMKKSILARAFRGELGTNDPTDEPAIELLKKII